MKRRTLLNQSAIAASSAALVACRQRLPPSEAEGTTAALPKLRWRMVTSWPKSLDTIFGAAQYFCDQVAAMTGGNFQITPYAAGEIVPGLGVLDAVQDGTVECGHTGSYYYVGKNPALGFATSIPFGLSAQQQNAWLYFGGGLEAIHNLYSDFNIINFPCGNTGGQMGGWFKKPVQTVSDLQGLKMRIPGQGGQVMAALGVNVQVLPGGEVFLALDRGAINAAEWVGPYDDEKLGLNKAAKYYYYPGWWEPGPTLDALINKSQWEKLPEVYKAVIETAAKAANQRMLVHYDALNGKALQRLVDSGTELTAYSDEILDAAQKASTALLSDMASKDPSFKAIYDQWLTFRTEIFQWNQINQLSYARFIESNSSR